ncbi:MAG: hypothetical protein AAGM33_08035, partial [Pseudomonadota bacterium]
MHKFHFIGAAAVAGLAASLLPLAAGQAHDGKHKFDKEWSENLAKEIHAKVHAGLAKGAVGMEKGADKMLRGADKMEAYAERLENDPEFREQEAAKQNKWREADLSADDMLEKAEEMRRGAEEMRRGAEEMR